MVDCVGKQISNFEVNKTKNDIVFFQVMITFGLPILML